MDFAVFFAATAAHRDHVWPIRQVDLELLLESLSKFITTHFLHQLCECRAIANLAQRKAAGPIHVWIVVVYCRAGIGLHKFRNNQKFEWLASEWRRAEPFQIEH